MAAKIVLFHEATRKKIIERVNILTDAVKVTTDPRDCNVILDRFSSLPCLPTLA